MIVVNALMIPKCLSVCLDSIIFIAIFAAHLRGNWQRRGATNERSGADLGRLITARNLTCTWALAI